MYLWFISVINQLDAQNFGFTISLFHAYKCFEHMCSSSGGQNWITQPLVSYQMLCNAILTSWWWAHVLETFRGMKYTYCKTKILCIKLVNYWDKFLSQPVHETATYRCDDTRGYIMQFWPPDDEHMCSKHVEAWNKIYCKANILCNKLVNYWDKYTDMHGQQNIKKYLWCYIYAKHVIIPFMDCTIDTLIRPIISERTWVSR